MFFGQNAVFHVLGFDDLYKTGVDPPSDVGTTLMIGNVFPGEVEGAAAAAIIQDRIQHRSACLQHAQHSLSVYCHEGATVSLHSPALTCRGEGKGASPLDDRILASETSLVAGSPVDVQLDVDPYLTPVTVRVTSLDATLAYFAENPTSSLLPPPAADDDTAITISCTPLGDVPW